MMHIPSDPEHHERRAAIGRAEAAVLWNMRQYERDMDLLRWAEQYATAATMKADADTTYAQALRARQATA